MKRLRYLVVAALFVLCPAMVGYGAESAADVTYEVSFSSYTGGPALPWLARQGFAAKRDATNPKSVVFSFADKSLVLETKKRAAALLLNEKDVLNFSRIRIEWGVDIFPAGASYLGGVRSEAVMVIVFFGSKKLPSGSLLIPDSPYFIGLFLCEKDPIDEAFNGRYFQAGGRYVCVDHATIGKSVVSDYPIAAAFRRFFGKDEVPPISGIGISIDTESAKGSGAAKAFIRKIEFVK
jgi:hypothetical protein